MTKFKPLVEGIMPKQSSKAKSKEGGKAFISPQSVFKGHK